LEYTTSGTLVQTINISSSGASALTLQGNVTSEGLLQLSDNGQYLLLAGYRDNAGNSKPSEKSSASINRVIGRVAISSGAVDTSTALTDAYSAVSIRGVSSDNGTRFWTSGQAANPSGGLRSVGSLGATTSTLLGSSGNDFYQVSVVGGNLYASSGSTPGHSVYQVGTGLPTGGSPTLTSSFAGSTQVYQSFYFTNLGSGNNWNGTGYDTLYAIDSAAGNLCKYSFNGTSWVANGTTSTSQFLNLTGYTQGTSVTLFITASGGTNVEAYTDTSGFSQTMNGSFSTLASAGSNYSFRGVAYVRGTPEPGSFVLVAAAGVVMTLLRLRRLTRPSSCTH
jgi:hypothetical protein